MVCVRYPALFAISGAPVYLSSQSFMSDSSLSEEMSQFDFSTGVQSFSFSSQNVGGQRRNVAKKVCFPIILLSRSIALKLPCFLDYKVQRIIRRDINEGSVLLHNAHLAKQNSS